MDAPALLTIATFLAYWAGVVGVVWLDLRGEARTEKPTKAAFVAGSIMAWATGPLLYRMCNPLQGSSYDNYLGY